MKVEHLIIYQLIKTPGVFLKVSSGVTALKITHWNAKVGYYLNTYAIFSIAF